MNYSNFTRFCAVLVFLFFAVSCSKDSDGNSSSSTDGTADGTANASLFDYQKTGLPIVYVNVPGGKYVTSRDVYTNATVSIDGSGKYDNLEASEIEMKGHGNSTWYMKKKPYLMRFPSKTKVLGMPKHKRWLLIANFIDRTLMRNIVSYKISSLTGMAYTTKCVPCELVFNGVHCGNYLLCEQVRVDENRLDIDEDKAFLFEMDGHYNNEVQWMDPHGIAGLAKFKGQGLPFSIKNPDPDVLTAEQIQWAKDYIYEVAEALYGSSYTDPENGYAKYLDLESFADYYIIFECAMNAELGGPNSVYMYKEPDGKLTAGPAWDFDWGTYSFLTKPAGRDGLAVRNSIWYRRMLTDPAFQKVVKQRWSIIYSKLKEQMPDFIEQQRELLRESDKLNYKLWDPAEDKSSNNGELINKDEELTFDEAVDRLKSVLMKHLEIMDGVFAQW